MSHHLRLHFADREHLVVSLAGRSAGVVDFASPITRQDRQDLRWYLEVYAADYTTEVDDAEARRIEARLPEWGRALFEASFGNAAARGLLDRFRASSGDERLLTVTADHPSILAMPWELLRDPSGTYLFDESPSVSIRRQVASSGAERGAPVVRPKQRLHVLFVCSRPSDAAFIDPRAESSALLEAAERHASGRMDVEFLRPATFRNLVERLADSRCPAVDVIHFDGHGILDADGSIGHRKPGSGYLLFERDSGLTQHVSPEFWSEKIGACIPLVILSACQSAAIAAAETYSGGDAPIGSVACGLAASGSARAVLAMTHSLLAGSAKALFAEFYRHLAQGTGVGVAVDAARRELVRNSIKHEVQRGPLRVPLSLQDWFLPALYQATPDGPLLDAQHSAPASNFATARDDPGAAEKMQGDTFVGRQRELWDIERWFVEGVRRISIAGFGGQGKSRLAMEVGRWLRRSGLFERLVVVCCAEGDGEDAVAHVQTALAEAQGEYTAGVQQPSTLLILDRLDSLLPQALKNLLDAGVEWTEGGAVRLIVVGRNPNLHHAGYAPADFVHHRRLVLAAFARSDAFDYLRSLLNAAPLAMRSVLDDNAMADVLEAIGFHPLSVRLLARHFLNGGAADRDACLRSLFPVDDDSAAGDLLDSLAPSFAMLPAAWWPALLHLGVMRGGAMELALMLVSESTLRQIQMQAGGVGILDPVTIGRSAWTQMREQLEAAALIAFESLDGVFIRYVRFHPALAPLMWSRLPASERDTLTVKHRLWYYLLSAQLYNGDFQHPDPIRAIARLELPNLLHAVRGALEAGEEWSPQFGRNVIHFLERFGMNRESAALVERISGPTKVAAQPTEPTLPRHAPGPMQKESAARRLALRTRGRNLLRSGDAAAAVGVFSELLDELGPIASLDRSLALDALGECYLDLHQPGQAGKLFVDALNLLQELQQARTDLFPQRLAAVERQRAALLGNLGLAFEALNRVDEARAAFEQAAALGRQLGDLGLVATLMTQLGYLALGLGELDDAERHYNEAAEFSRRVNEPGLEALSRHQLGMVFQKAGRWDEAEQTYRDAAQIREAAGELERAADSWNLLGQISAITGKPEAAEAWFRKALATRLDAGDGARSAGTLCDLAALLQRQPARLREAQKLAEQSLAIKQELHGDPGSTEIWLTYTVLAEISEAQGRDVQAQRYHRLARTAWHDYSKG